VELEHELGREPRMNVLVKKVGRKKNRRKREETMDNGNDMGLYSTLESTLKKEAKIFRGTSGSVPPKGGGGGTKSIGK
jgi:hypothetical protein